MIQTNHLVFFYYIGTKNGDSSFHKQHLRITSLFVYL